MVARKNLTIEVESPVTSPLPTTSTTKSKRMTHPDVPQDIDSLLEEHWNDPNYDVNGLPSPTASSTDSFELESKGRRASNYSGSEFDGESHYGSSKAHSASKLKFADDEVEESPYPEVRAAVSNVDDPSIPVNTIRMWVIGIFFSAALPAFNQLFSLRYPAVFMAGVVVQLLSLPIGRFFEWALPTTRFNTFGYVWTLNPGPFNAKEHTVITVMAKIVELGAYATDLLLSQELFYGKNFGFGYEVMICLSSQLMGYAFAGLFRRFLVWPSNMIWPGALVNSALFNTLHRTYTKKDKGHMSRQRFFVIAAAASFVWYWFPGYIFTALSWFTWACWIAPNNIVVNSLFGYISGLGMGFITFDWTVISYFGSPLVTPWWAQVNTTVSFVFWFWLIVPIIYFTNTWNTAYFPVNSPRTYTNTGAVYDVTQIITDGLFDVEKYRNYSPVFLSASFIMMYCLSLAALTAVVTHTYLWYGRDIIRQLRTSIKDEKDIHSRLMSRYRDIPHWWFAIVFVVSFILGAVSIEVYDTKMPFWAYIFAIIIAFVFVLPLGILLAITNQQLTLNVFTELVAGYVIPGRPIAVMIFKVYGTIMTKQALDFSGHLKLGHYMKVPPRIMFVAQTIASVVSCFVVVIVQRWALTHIEDVCQQGQKNGFVCPSSTVFAEASLLYGGVGPSRLFGPGQTYYGAIWFLLIGAVSPIPFYFLARRYPRSLFRYVNIPVVWAGPTGMPPGTGINFSSSALVGFIFQFYLRRYRYMWWTRYNYLLSLALDFGVAVAAVVIFFTVVFPGGGQQLNWWGNTVYTTTADFNYMSLKTVPDGQFFGPRTWQ